MLAKKVVLVDDILMLINEYMSFLKPLIVTLNLTFPVLYGKFLKQQQNTFNLPADGKMSLKWLYGHQLQAFVQNFEKFDA